MGVLVFVGYCCCLSLDTNQIIPYQLLASKWVRAGSYVDAVFLLGEIAVEELLYFLFNL